MNKGMVKFAYAFSLALATGGITLVAAGGHPGAPDQGEKSRVIVLSAPENKASTPTMALGPDGSINLIWVEKLPVQAKIPAGETHTHRIYTNLYFARSTDGGRTFTEPIRVNSVEGSVWGFSTSRPKIVVDDSGVIHVFFSGNRATATADKDATDARYTRSTDGGRTFERERTLNTILKEDQSKIVGGGLSEAHCFGTMAVGPDGSVHAFWIDTRHMNAPGANGSIYGAVSWDRGKTFEPDRLISRDTACPCCQLDAAFSPRGTLFLSMRHVYPEGFRNSVVLRSDDGGKTFSAPVRLTSKKWMINGCPLKPAILATDQEKWVYAAWFTAAETPPGVYFTVSEDGGKTFAEPRAIHPGAKISDHPQLAVGPKGGVYVVWDAKVSGPRRAYLRISYDHGKTFGPIRALGSGETASMFPTVAVASDGTVFVAWQQDNKILFQALEPLIAKK